MDHTGGRERESVYILDGWVVEVVEVQVEEMELEVVVEQVEMKSCPLTCSVLLWPAGAGRHDVQH